MTQKTTDPRELPYYGVTEAAHYLRIPAATIRSWVKGRSYPTGQGRQFFEPLIELPDPQAPWLSFINLIEVHVLDAIRREHRIAMHKIRKAIDLLKIEFQARHPLAEKTLETDGLDLFVQEVGELFLISQDGQMAMRTMLQAHLKRIERDGAGLAARLYPFTRKRQPNEPRFVVIDPLLGYGRPVLAQTGIPTAMIAGRYKAGESIDELARDYDRRGLEIEEAIRCELQLEAA